MKAVGGGTARHGTSLLEGASERHGAVVPAARGLLMARVADAPFRARAPSRRERLIASPMCRGN